MIPVAFECNGINKNRYALFGKIVENMIADGVDTFIEVGVGKTLTGLIGRINADVKAYKVETPEDIEKVLR